MNSDEKLLVTTAVIITFIVTSMLVCFSWSMSTYEYKMRFYNEINEIKAEAINHGYASYTQDPTSPDCERIFVWNEAK